MKEELQNAVIAEAMTWLGTPWHHRARVKGAGVDCAQFLIAVYSAAGLIPEFDSGDYPKDWHLHQDEPRFKNWLLQFADPVATPEPGDVAMFRFGRHESHASIVIDFPKVIHAWIDEKMVVVSDASLQPLKNRVAGFYRLKGI